MRREALLIRVEVKDHHRWAVAAGAGKTVIACAMIAAHGDQRTAKWTAITTRLVGTHGHFGALVPQVEATDALAGRSLDLHGMQEVRGSNPRSST